MLKRRRGNPNWTKPVYASLGPTVASFDAIVKELGLSPEQFETSDVLKQWVLKNKDQKYVPLDLLRAWKLAAV